MSFRKRNVAISPGSSRISGQPSRLESSIPTTSSQSVTLPLGVRPSPLDGRLTTSTGTQSLDGLLAGHAGLALGTSLLIEEKGTTDYAGTLLRYYAAEGVVQGHTIHVVGVGEQWSRELPGLIRATAGKKEVKIPMEAGKMKIAWRYERLGNEGAGVSGSRATLPLVSGRSPASAPMSQQPNNSSAAQPAFCHTFDLTKRLTIPSPSPFNFIPPTPQSAQSPPYAHILRNLSQHLSTSQPASVHRLIIPTLLSPALYPMHACQPQQLLPFLHAVRGLLRRYPTQLSAMLTLPLDLFPRHTGLTRWIELLSDGVMELTPFPHQPYNASSLASSGAATAQEEQPQGLMKIHRLPVFHEKGGGGGGGWGTGSGDDLAFTVSRKNFVIKPFSLPPVEGDTEAQQQTVADKPAAVDMDF